jgi:hypothetical protein
MAQKWYIQFHDRTVGPITPRQLHTLARIGELTPRHQVSLDKSHWFVASKVLGLFADRRQHRRNAPGG